MEQEWSVLLLGLIVLVLGVVPLVLWIWSLIHCVTNRRLSDTNRLVGVLLIVFLNLIGSFVYLFLPRESQSTVRRPHA